MYTQTHKLNRLLLYRNFRIMQWNRNLHFLQFIYLCIEGHDCLEIQFSGMDHISTEVLDLPVQTQFIATFDSLQINILIHRKLRRKTADPALFFPYIKQIHIQSSLKKRLPFTETHFIHRDIRFTLYQPSNVRFDIRYIIILVKSHLGHCFILHMQHLNTFFF